MRIIVFLVFAAFGVAMGCSADNSCIQVGTGKEFGTDHLEKARQVSDHAKELGLPTTAFEAAYIVGAAYAASQLEGGQAGVPVEICLRSGNDGATEYRVLSTAGKQLINWQSVTDPRGP